MHFNVIHPHRNIWGYNYITYLVFSAEFTPKTILVFIHWFYMFWCILFLNEIHSKIPSFFSFFLLEHNSNCDAFFFSVHSGNVFLSYKAELEEVYKVYCQNHNESISLLEAYEKDENVQRHVQDCLESLRWVRYIFFLQICCMIWVWMNTVALNNRLN